MGGSGDAAQADAKVRLAFIAGAGLSGSTLLEQTLSQVEGCFTIGELYWMWKPWWPLAVCECGEQFGNCPFWQGVLDDAFGSEQEAMRARLEAIGEGFIRHSVMPTLRASHPKYKFFSTFKEAGELLEPVYRAAANRSGASVLVEATKAGLWGMCAATSDAIEMAVVRLVRDPRGFTFSNARARAFHYPPGSMTTPHGAARSYVNWLLANLEGDWLRRRAFADTYVLYEDLTRDPTAAIRSIARTLGLGAESTGALDQDTLVIDRVGHAIGGNPRRPKRGSTVIATDDEWRTAGKRSLRVLAPLVLPLWHHYERKAGASRVA
ncbi:MAG TPA: sulfotransferase [Acidimicrobiia bacterium]|nr:sulfotransferase [Acidimicrobiia bacterium]